MPIFPIRNLAKYGVVTDPDPYDIPNEAWSFAVNARFRNGKLTRGPVWRGMGTLGTTAPRFCVGATPTTGQDALYIGYLNGTVTQFTSGVESSVTLSGYVPSSAEATWTACHLADVQYINRSDRTPWYRRTSDALYQNLTTGAGPVPWNPLWSALILRASNGALCAYNVTKSGVNVPTMVKTSGFPLSGTVPLNWDQTDPATSATENILAEMEGGIVDALGLGNLMFIYGQNETWLQQFVAGQNIWNYAKAFSNRGIINTNCVIEVERRHFVFGVDDIWVHDGITPMSICDERTREFIFGGINLTSANRCFIVHNADLKEILFCYPSGDSAAQFRTGSTGCNRAATYDYQNDKWTFDDLPDVYSGSRASLDKSATWASLTSTWSSIGGSWQDMQDTGKKSTVFVGDTNANYNLTRSLYAFDPSGPLSKVSAPVDTNATIGLTATNIGIDLDEVGAELRGYKVCNSIYPQGRLDADAASVTFQIGSSDYFNQAPIYAPPMTWDGNTLYKLDFNAAGRFLSIIITFPDWHFMSLSGFDVDLSVLGKR